MFELPNSIPESQHRLLIYRRMAALLASQGAEFGASSPADTRRQLANTHDEIARIKRVLREHGAVVEDTLEDAEGTDLDDRIVETMSEDAAPLLQYELTLAEQLRYVPLAGLTDRDDISLQLADVYVERILELMEQVASPDLAISSAGPAPRKTTLAEITRSSRARIVLEGTRGSGKSTCLRALALACASSAAGGSRNQLELLANSSEPLPLPILLTAQEVAAAIALFPAAFSGQSLPMPAVFEAALWIWLQHHGLGVLLPVMLQAVERGSCLVLLDGLDDVPELADPLVYAQALTRLVAHYPADRYIVTCRGLDAGEATAPAGFTRYALAPLDQAQCDAMIAHWCNALAEQSELRAMEQVSNQIAMLQYLLHHDEWLCDLRSHPLELVACILAYAEGYTLPNERLVVLHRLCQHLFDGPEEIGKGDTQRHGGGNKREQSGLQRRRIAPLARMALALQQRVGPADEQPVALSRAELEALLDENTLFSQAEWRSVDPHGISTLLQWYCRHGLIAEIGPGIYTFPRQWLREYLAAPALAELSDFSTQTYALRHRPHWQRTLLLAVRELGLGWAPQVAIGFVRLLLYPSGPGRDRASADLLLAAKCLIELGEQVEREPRIHGEAVDRLLKLSSDPAATLAERLQAGSLLSRLGDPRFVEPLPPLVQVAAGPFILGSNSEYDDEGPAQHVSVPTFMIGVYPVTNGQYALFLADSGHTLPRYWQDPRFNQRSYPVVGVTWYDATAYCAWLTTRLHRAGLLPPETVVRLPLEVEWEKAASWDPVRKAKRRYPWGDEWNSAYANTADGRSDWLIAPVGCYPGGVSAYSLHDCIGNVWEWTASRYESYPGMATPFQESGSYTLRGSSCISKPTHARCTFRSRLPATYWRYHLGFRIVLARPLDKDVS